MHLEANPRLEQRAVTMLLGALPESFRQDIIASRRLTATGILFRLYTSYQPGGSGERTGLIRSLSEVKVLAGLVELLGSIRQWRRSLGRSGELRVTIDPLVLTGVLSKFADGAAKLGGSQVAFRLAPMRQQYIQAELEELANAQVAGKATPSNPPALAPVLTQGIRLSRPYPVMGRSLGTGMMGRNPVIDRMVMRHHVVFGALRKDVAGVRSAHMHILGDHWRKPQGPCSAHPRSIERRIVQLSNPRRGMAVLKRAIGRLPRSKIRRAKRARKRNAKNTFACEGGSGGNSTTREEIRGISAQAGV